MKFARGLFIFIAFYIVLGRGLRKILLIIFNNYRQVIADFLKMSPSDKYMDLMFIVLYSVVLIIIVVCIHKFHMKKVNKR